MKRIFLDTNFLMDYVEREEYKPQCIEVLIKGKEQKAKFYISFLSLANFAYINRKKEKEILYEALKRFVRMFNVLPNTKEHIQKAIALEAKDYEDAVQYATAVSAGCDCILTRNAKDFTFATIPVLSPQEFLATLTD